MQYVKETTMFATVGVFAISNTPTHQLQISVLRCKLRGKPASFVVNHMFRAKGNKNQRNDVH